MAIFYIMAESLEWFAILYEMVRNTQNSAGLSSVKKWACVSLDLSNKIPKPQWLLNYRSFCFHSSGGLDKF